MEVNFAVFVTRADGVVCTMIRSKLDGFSIELERGEGVVEVFLDPIRLATGSYFVEVGVTDASDSLVLHRERARSDGFFVEGRGRGYDSRSGVFDADAEWRLQPAVEPHAPPESAWEVYR